MLSAKYGSSNEAILSSAVIALWLAEVHGDSPQRLARLYQPPAVWRCATILTPSNRHVTHA